MSKSKEEQEKILAHHRKLREKKDKGKKLKKKELLQLLNQCEHANVILQSMATGESMPLSSFDRLLLLDALDHEAYKGKIQEPATPAITRQVYRSLKEKLIIAENKYQQRVAAQVEKEKKDKEAEKKKEEKVLVDPKDIPLSVVKDIGKKKVH